MFYKKENDSVVFLGVYADDILMTGNNKSKMCSPKQFLDQQFKNKDFSHLQYLLRNKAIQKIENVILPQRKFTFHLLDEFHCGILTLASTPLVVGLKLSLDIGELLSDLAIYKCLVGKLNYLTNPRSTTNFKEVAYNIFKKNYQILSIAFLV